MKNWISTRLTEIQVGLYNIYCPDYLRKLFPSGGRDLSIKFFPQTWISLISSLCIEHNTFEHPCDNSSLNHFLGDCPSNLTYRKKLDFEKWPTRTKNYLVSLLNNKNGVNNKSGGN